MSGTTLNHYSVGLGLNAAGMVSGSKLARAEMSQLTSILRNSKPDAQRLADGINLVDKAFAQGRINIKQYEQSLEHLRKKYGETEQAAKSAAASLSVAAPLGNLASGAGFGGVAGMLTSPAAASAAGVAAIGFGAKQVLQLQASAESTAASFEVLTGSVRQAQQMVASMKRLDQESSLNFMDIQQAGKTVLGYGLAVDQVIPSLKQLGDISMGNADRFKSLSLAFGQVQANGRLMGQEVLQMVNAGFNPLQEISRTTGVSMVQLKKDMEQGLITAKMLSNSIYTATEEGGRFFGMSEKMAATAEGQWAKTVSDLQMIGTELGKNLMPASIELLKVFRDLAPALGLLNPVLDGLSIVTRSTVGIFRDFFGDLYEISTLDFSNLFDFQNSNKAWEDILNKNRRITEEVAHQNVSMVEQSKILGKIAEETKAIEAIQKSIDDAIADRTNTYLKQREELQKQIDIFELGEEAVRRLERQRNGFTDVQIRQLEELERQVKIINQIKEADNKRWQGIAEDNQRIEEMRNRKIEAPGAFDVGSQEAYRFKVETYNSQVSSIMADNEELKRDGKEQIQLAKEANRLLHGIMENNVKRIR